MHPTATLHDPTKHGAAARRCEEAKKLLEQAKIDEAIHALESLSAAERTGTSLALLGVARFRNEQYDQAEALLRQAIARGVHDEEIAYLLETAAANAVASIHERVPEPYQFDPEKIPAGPEPMEPYEPGTRLLKPKKVGRVDSLLRIAGNATGFLLGKVMVGTWRLVGNESKQEVWTTWSRKNGALALMMLANRRERLNKENLFDAYPKGTLVGFYKGDMTPPPRALTARTADGSWNDLENPMAGMAGTRFGYNTDPKQTGKESGDKLLTPNPRTVSRVLLTRNEGIKKVPFLNLIAASWIQFMNHGWVSYGDSRTDKLYKIPLEPDDPARKRLHQTHMFVGATQDDPSGQHPGDPTVGHVNEISSWWDGSQIYGCSEAAQKRVRSGKDGKLAVDPKTGNLPLAKDGIEETGFRRNWWLGLSMLHTLFTKEHNSICDMLKIRYPQWGDQQLFDTARLINGAVMAKIHTVEWTPAVLPNKTLNTGMYGNWYGTLTNLFRSKDHHKALASFETNDPMLGGVVGGRVDNFGVPYSLTREFLSVYRLHSLMPDEFIIKSIDGSRANQTVPLAKVRAKGSHKLTDVTSMADLLFSFGTEHPGQLVLNNYPKTLQNLSVPGFGFYDLGAIDVLRDRERGVPRYNQFRRLFGLNPIRRFEDLTDDPDQVAALKKVYNNDIEQIDLLVGNLAEATRPEHFGFGETMFVVFIVNATRRLQGDRFFTTDYRPEIYTPAGLAWVDEVTFKQVLLRHYPELAKTGLANVENGFEPWDTGELTADRHPLRSYDKELA